MIDTPEGDLHRRVAVVTGAGGGIGSAIAGALHDAGHRVVLTDLRAEPLLGLLPDRPDVERVTADVTSREGADAVRERALGTFGHLDAWINVVGGMRGPLRREFLSIDEHQLDFALMINLRATFLCMQAALPTMLDQGGGRIVNIASTAWAGSPDHADYAAAKAGVVALTRSVALEVARHGITVNAVAPGLTITDRLRRHGMPFDTDAIPSGVPNAPSDVADAVVFLCSEGARNITGQVLNVAGGLNPSI